MTNMKKMLAACVLISSPAWAGEVTGTGESTPIRNGVANSICAFSGLNDDGAGPNPAVQSYGQQVAFFRGRAPFHGIPGISCNGS
ncbi:MAG: hypothetical protein V4696_14545 [Pseudomonadota bacterium]